MAEKIKKSEHPIPGASPRIKRGGSSGAETARSGDAKSNNAVTARGQKSERNIPEPVAGKLARTGGKIPVDGTNKKGKGA